MDVWGGSLHVRGQDPGVITRISVKGVAVLPPFGFHDVKWESPEEVLEGSSYVNGVALDPRETSCYGCFQNPGGCQGHSTLSSQRVLRVPG